jgi:glycosyltransferase involved in cell wall biosynthesis
MASGVPIVASDLPSIREVLTNENAYWFKADDKNSLATQIEFVLSQPELSQLKAARARDDVKIHTWSARARAILDFIR